MVWRDLGKRSGPEYMDAFLSELRHLDEAGADDMRRTYRLTGAMVNLVGLAVRLHHEPGASWVHEELPAFRSASRRLLLRQRPALSGYMALMETSLWEGSQEGWYEVCIRRSAIQLVIDELEADTPTRLVEPQRIREDDEEMRETAPTVPALPPDIVPPLSQTHWWWRAPEVPDASAPLWTPRHTARPGRGPANPP